MPVDRIPNTTDVAAAVAALRARAVTLVLITWVDNAGVPRAVTVPTERLAHAVREGLAVPGAQYAFGGDDRAGHGPADELSSGGHLRDLRVVPDLDRLTPLAAQPGWAWAPADAFTQEGLGFAGCQRRFAAAQVAAAGGRGLSVRMAFRSEWSLGRADGRPDFVPAFESSAYGRTGLGAVADYTRELVAALAAQGLTVEHLHPDHGPAQLSLAVAPEPPVRAADDVLLLRESVRRISAGHGWQASFAPTVAPDAAGAGAHLRMWLTDDDGPLLAGGDRRHQLRPAGEAFLAGVLRELPALCAVGVADPAGYLRLRPSRRAGAWQCWGRDSREAALRFVRGVIGAGSGSAQAEVRCLDASGNPYLVVGAVLAAGLAGVAEGLRLPPDMCGDPAELSDHERWAAGIHRLPSSLSEAAEALADSRVLAEAMGEPLHAGVLAHRRAEGKRYSDTMPDELAARCRWRY